LNKQQKNQQYCWDSKWRNTHGRRIINKN